MIPRRTVSVFLVSLAIGSLLTLAGCSSPAAPAPTQAPAPAPAATKAAAPAPAATQAAPASAATKPAEATKPVASGPQYPTKSITFVIPFAPGGVVDQAGRFLAAYAQEKWKVAVTVDNRAGGGGFIGTVAGLQAPPDGYTLYLDGPSTFYGLAATKNPPFKIEDGTAINRVTINPVAFGVKGDSKWNSLKDVVADVKAAPEKYKMASAGAAGLATMAGAKLWIQAGIDPAKVPIMVFDGGAPAYTAVAGGNADFCSQNLAETISLYQAQKIKILAVTTPERFSQVKDVPTSKEAGFEQYSTVGFVDLWGPSKLPENIVNAWDSLVKEAVKDPKFLDQLDKAGFLPGYQSPKEHRDFINAEYKFAADIANKLGIVQ